MGAKGKNSMSEWEPSTVPSREAGRNPKVSKKWRSYNLRIRMMRVQPTSFSGNHHLRGKFFSPNERGS
jgi:hypothetical protein